jgi:Mn-dependent DtxR family transcriptional regulator
VEAQMIVIPTHILKMKNVYAPGKMVLAVVEANPDITFRGIAEILYISPITVKDTIRHLHNNGFVTMTGKGKRYTYRINAK